MTSNRQLFPNANRRVTFGCFWESGCSDSARCNARGSCVAASQAGGATFPQQMEPDNRPLSHMEILSAVAHHAGEIARLTAAIPVQCKPDETAERLCTRPNGRHSMALDVDGQSYCTWCDWPVHDVVPAVETSAPQAPIAKVTVRESGAGHYAPDDVSVTLYAPGLPPGEHDVFCEPESIAPYLRAKAPADHWIPNETLTLTVAEVRALGTVLMYLQNDYGDNHPAACFAMLLAAYRRLTPPPCSAVEPRETSGNEIGAGIPPDGAPSMPEHSPLEPTVPNAHCNGCGQDYVATKGHVCPAVKAPCERCEGSGRLTIYDTAMYPGQACSPIGDEPCPACQPENGDGDGSGR